MEKRRGARRIGKEGLERKGVAGRRRGGGGGKSLGYSNIKWASMRETETERERVCVCACSHITIREQLIHAINPFHRGSEQTSR